MTITLPDDMREMLEREAREAKMPSVDVYVRVMYERAKHYYGVNGEEMLDEFTDDGTPILPLTDPAVRQALLRLAEQGTESESIPAPAEFLEDLRRRAEERLAAGEPAR